MRSVLRVIRLLNHFWWFQSIPSLKSMSSLFGFSWTQRPHSIHRSTIVATTKIAISGEQKNPIFRQPPNPMPIKSINNSYLCFVPMKSPSNHPGFCGDLPRDLPGLDPAWYWERPRPTLHTWKVPRALPASWSTLDRRGGWIAISAWWWGWGWVWGGGWCWWWWWRW